MLKPETIDPAESVCDNAYQAGDGRLRSIDVRDPNCDRIKSRSGLGDVEMEGLMLGRMCLAPASLLIVLSFAAFADSPTETTIISHDSEPSSSGRSIAVHVHVSADGTPTGSIEVTGEGVSCSIELPDRHCLIEPIAEGLLILTAQYSGDTNFSPSKSSPVTHVVADVPGLQRVSVGVQATHFSHEGSRPHLSGDGRYVVYQTAVPELIGQDSAGWSQIVLFDSQSKLSKLISKAPDGAPGNQHSGGGRISNDGRFVAFCSSATNLIPEFTGGIGHVYVADVETGMVDWISEPQGSSPLEGPPCASRPAISNDGRFVAFASYESNLVDGPVITDRHLHIKDRQTGALFRLDSIPARSFDMSGDGTRFAISAPDGYYPGDSNFYQDVFFYDHVSENLTLVSAGFDGSQSSLGAGSFAFSGDGQHLFFTSSSTNLLPDIPGDQFERLYRFSPSTAQLDLIHTELMDHEMRNLILMDVDSTGSRLLLQGRLDRFDPHDFSSASLFLADIPTGEVTLQSSNNRGELTGFVTEHAHLSGDGLKIVFDGFGDRLFDYVDRDVDQVVVLRDTSTGLNQPVSAEPFTTELPLGIFSRSSAIHGGSYVAASSSSGNIVSDDPSLLADCYIFSTSQGNFVRVPGVPGIQNFLERRASGASVSADGRLATCIYVIVYVSNSGALRGINMAIAYDFETEETFSLTPCSVLYPWIWYGDSVSVSADGNWVVFSTTDFCLDPADTSPSLSLYMWSRSSQSFELIAGTQTGIEANGGAWSPMLSGDGQLVFYVTTASNAIAEDSDDLRDVHLHDRQTGDYELLSVDVDGNKSTRDVNLEAITLDGRYVLMETKGTFGTLGQAGISSLFLLDRSDRSLRWVSATPDGKPLEPYGNVRGVLSGNGRFLVLSYNLSDQARLRVMDLDRNLDSTLIVSEYAPGAFGVSSKVIGVSDSLDRIMFRSKSNALVLDDRNDETDLFVWKELVFSDAFDADAQ